MTEIRTTSSTGGQKGVKPERHDLMPRRALGVIARVFGFGAEKYEDHNWRRGYEWGKSLASLQRHIDSFVEGDTYDEESGLPHLAHAGFHILALLTWLEEQGEGVQNPFDDRWMHSMERARVRSLERARVREEALEEFRLSELVGWVGPDLLPKHPPYAYTVNEVQPTGDADAIAQALQESINRRASSDIPVEDLRFDG